MKERTLPPGWRLSEEYSESKQADYVKKMTEEQSAIPRVKREVPNTWKGKPTELLNAEEREEFYFSMQPQSTQAAIIAQKARKPEDDIDHPLRPMPECVANPSATSLDELTALRSVSMDDALREEERRRRPKNSIGQSEVGSVDSEKRAKGIQAFTYSKPADLTPEQVKKLTKLTEIANTPLEPIEKPKKNWRNLFGIFQGNAGLEMFKNDSD